MNDSFQRALTWSLAALLVVWGAITTIAFFDSPVHQMAMIGDSGRALVSSICGEGATCGGIVALFATAFHGIVQLSPFAIYIFLSVVALAVFAVWCYMRDEEWVLRGYVTPLMMSGLFVLAAWGLLVGFAYSNNGNLPMNRVIEPSAQVYPDASEEGLATLKNNFDSLKKAGCLIPRQGIEYSYSFLCLQGGFLGRAVSHMLMIALLVFNVLVLGRAALHAMRLRQFPLFAEGVVSAGFGACLLVALLWLIAIAGVYVSAIGWGLIVILPLALWRHSVFWGRTFWSHRVEFEVRPWSMIVILSWLLVSYLALNFLNVVRPFPIGWDDLGRYLNQPRLLVSYGHFIPTLSTFSWEYVTSLGFLWFGYDSVFGATLSMLINWSAGLLAVMVVWLFGRVYLGEGRGILAALLYYTLPMVGHFSFADMKVDNAIFAVGSLGALCVFLALCPPYDVDGDEEHRTSVLPLLALAGLFCGFGFAMKPTVTMLILALGTVMVGAQSGWAGMLGASFGVFAILVKQGIFKTSEVMGRVFGDSQLVSQNALAGSLFIVGVAIALYGFRGRFGSLKTLGIRLGVFALALAVPILPWMVSNNLSYGHFPLKLELSYANRMSPAILIDGSQPPVGSTNVRSLPPELQVDSSNPACVSTSKAEELDRYWGNYPGAWHYLGLPWRAVMNIDTYGYYVTLVPALFLVPLLLSSPFFWSRDGRWQRVLLGATLLMVIQWCFLANGIVWYGVSMFLGLVILLEALAVTSPTKTTRVLASVLLGISLLTAYSHRMWQFDIMQNIFEYPMGKVSAAAMEERTIPHYDDIRDAIEARAAATPERPYVYRMGTFIPYFIPKNFEVLPLADNQLDMFNCLFQERDAALTLKRLQTLGFNSMIFDTNTQTIERDVNGSLHKKVQAFVDFVNSPGNGIQIMINDPNAGIAFILLP